MSTIPELYRANIEYIEDERNFLLPLLSNASITFENDFWDLILKPKRRNDALDVNTCDIIDYTNLREVSPGNLAIIKDSGNGLIYLKVDNIANPYSFTLRTAGMQDVVYQSVILDAAVPVGLDRQVTIFIAPDGSLVNGAAFNGENQKLI